MNDEDGNIKILGLNKDFEVTCLDADADANAEGNCQWLCGGHQDCGGYFCTESGECDESTFAPAEEEEEEEEDLIEEEGGESESGIDSILLLLD